MSVYSKALHHVNNKDFKKTRQRCLDEQKFLSLKIREKEILEQQEIKQIKEISSLLKSDWKSELFSEVKQEVKKEEVKVKVKVSEKLKSDWKKELAEGMTTNGGEIQFAPSDVPLDTIDASDPASFTAANGGPNLDSDGDGLSGTAIVSSGSGTGNNGGFNLGQSYLSFNGIAYDDGDEAGLQNYRFAVLTPLDLTRATTLEITAIVGNNSNGGESPEVGEDLFLGYAVGPNSYSPAYDDDFNHIRVIPYNGSGSLQTYSITIPSNEINNLRTSNVSFVLIQKQGTNSITGDNYGITEIKVKRTTPVSVVAPLDSPEAVSFFRVGTGPNVETPEQRYRRITQQLLASKNYTTTKFGSNYPGSNFSGISGVSASPIGKAASIDTWSKAAERNANNAIQTFSNFNSKVNQTPQALPGTSERNKLLYYDPRHQKTDQYYNSAEYRMKWGSSSIQSTSTSQMMYKDALKYAGYSDKEISTITQGTTYIQPQPKIQSQEPRERDTYSSPPTYQYGNEADFQRWVQSQQTSVGTQHNLPGGGTLSRVSDVGFKPQTTVTYNYDKVTDSGVQKSTYTGILKPTSVPPTPPKTQPQQNRLTPQQLANIDQEIKKLEADNQKIKADSTRRTWELVANLAMDVVTAAALLSPAPGDEAAVISARTAQQTQRMAKQYTRANPGQYNPFFTDYQNKLARSQNLGSNAMPLRPLKNSYEPQGQVISEKTVKTLKSVNQALYPGQPSPNGFPDQDLPKQLPNGFHQDYGQKDNMYNTLDKTSAMSMPPTGNPKIDKKVEKAKKQLK